MTTEQEFLGNAPGPENAPLAPSSASALQDAAALFEQARRAADNGEAQEALSAGAEAVGMAAVAVDLERREQAMAQHPAASAREQLVDERISRLDMIDGVGAARRPVPVAVADYLGDDVVRPLGSDRFSSVRVNALSLSTEEFMAAIAAEEEADQTRDLLGGGAR